MKRLLRKRRIGVSIAPSFVALTAALIVFGAGLETAAYVVSLVLHEWAHAAVAARCGFRLETVRLAPYGAQIAGELDGIGPREEVRIALAGPLLSLGIAIAGVACSAAIPAAARFFAPIVAANGSIGLCNLLPVFPLDGGRVLRAALTERMHAVRAARIARAVGLCVAVPCFAACCVGTLLGANPTAAIGGGFMLASALTAGKGARYTVLLDRARLSGALGRGVRLEWFAVDANMPAARALALADGKRYCVYAVCNDACGIEAIVTERDLRDRAAIAGAHASIGALAKRGPPPRNRA